MSSSESVKSKTCPFCSIRSRCVDFGRTMRSPLEAPADEHLRRRALEPAGDLPDALVVEVAAGPERAVGLDRDATLLAALQEGATVLERAELHLVDDGRRVGGGQQLVQLADAEVRDADR